MNPPLTSEILLTKLAAVRRKQVTTAVVTGLALTLTAAVGFLALNMILDCWLEISRTSRALLVLIDFATLGWIYFRRVIRPLMHQPDDEDVALWIEQQDPALRSRFISTIQLAQNQGDIQSSQLIHALISETEKIAAPINFAVAVPTAPMWRGCGIALIACLTGMLALTATKPGSIIYLQRAFLASRPAPRKTQLFCLTGNKTIARGDSLELEATATGVIPSIGQALLRRASKTTQTITLLPTISNPSHFHQTLDNVQEPFTYLLQLNDAVSAPYQIDVHTRPALATLTCEQQFPDYTRLPACARSPNDLSLLAGSLLLLKATATKPLQTATIWMEGLNEAVAMTIDPETTTHLSATIPIPTNAFTGFFIRLTDHDGLRSKDDVRYRVDIVSDTPPEVQIAYPTRREELATEDAQMLLSFEAHDDYGIQQALLHIKIGNTEVLTELDLQEQHPRLMKRRYLWNMVDLHPRPGKGNVIEYWLEVRDGNNVSGPASTTSEHYFARVAGEEEKKTELRSRFDQTLQTVEGVVKEQENLNQKLGELIQEKRSTP